MSESDSKKAAVTIYSTTWCAFCHTEMQWLDKLGVPYVKKDIDIDEEAHKELDKKMDGPVRGVPVTDIAGDLVMGFDRPKLQQALKSHKLVAA